ncbi:MAG: hypothetical protein J5656_06890 [Clostridia bacterium]|nr:hypothetical protein [Clostridia bacterium]
MNKIKLNLLYGLNNNQKNKIKEAFYQGNTHAVYTDTDSIIVSKDTSLCMYDYATNILKIME